MENNKDPNKNLPPISATDAKGVVWEYSPVDERWTAHIDGKKTYSKDYQKLYEKVSKIRASRDVKTQPSLVKDLPKPQEFAMIRLSAPKFSSGATEFRPVVVRTEWDAKVGAHKVIRYKEAQSKQESGSGWFSSGASTLRLMHPQFLSQEDRSYLEKVALFDLATTKLNAVWGKVSAAWWASKDQGSMIMEESYQHGLIQSKGFDSMSRRQAFVSKNWPHLSRPDDATPTWQPQEDGSYRAGMVSVRMVMEDKGPGGFSNPTFEVSCDRWPDPVFSGNFNVAMKIANATFAIVESTSEVQMEWRSSMDWGKNKSHHGSWPSLFKVHGGAIIRSEDRYSQTSISGWSLCEPVAHALSAPSGYHKLKDGQASALQWRPTQDYSGGVLFASCGPEDQVLPTIKSLLKEVEGFLSEHDIYSDKARLTSSPRDFSFPTYEPPQDVLGQVVAKVEEEGEDSTIAKTTQQIQSQFDHMYNRIKAQAQRSESFVQLEKLLDEKHDQIVALVSAPGQSKPGKSGPGPS